MCVSALSKTEVHVVSMGAVSSNMRKPLDTELTFKHDMRMPLDAEPTFMHNSSITVQPTML